MRNRSLRSTPRRSGLAPVLLAVLLAAVAMVAPAGAQEAAEPYELTIWADVTYAADGQITQLEFPQQDEYPAAFLENIRARIAARPPQPREDNGQPATFQTGVRVNVTVSPATGSVTVDAIDEAPRVTRMTRFVLREEDAILAEAGGVVRVRCTVSTKGRCQRVDFELADVPASTREYALRSMGGWRFEPQRLNGKPVAGTIVVPLEVESMGIVRPTIQTR
jgi:hypothetical protein